MNAKVKKILAALEELDHSLPTRFMNIKDGACKECGHLNQASYNFCPKCGSKLEDSDITRHRKWFKKRLREILGISSSELSCLFENEGFTEDFDVTQMEFFIDAIKENISFFADRVGKIYSKIVGPT